MIWRVLTVHQPYAELIALPDDDPRRKRIENRPAALSYRGPLLIHAGKDLAWLDDAAGWNIDPATLVFGALVAACELWAVYHVNSMSVGMMPEIETQHAHGPQCLMLRNVRRLRTPIPIRGQQGLWSYDDEGREIV